LYNKIHRTAIVAKLTVTNIATNRETCVLVHGHNVLKNVPDMFMV